MEEITMLDALNMARGVEEMPPYVDPDAVENVSTEYATWFFESLTKQAEESEVTEEFQLDLLSSTIAAAYILGRLDATNQPATESLTVTGKSGTIVNIHIS
jgi:hypothetical protein